jgi:hypothetical protein
MWLILHVTMADNSHFFLALLCVNDLNSHMMSHLS